jgi:acetylglutamate synthase
MKDESMNNKTESIFFLSDVINSHAILKDKKIGHLIDFIITNKEKVAEVTYVVISRPFGYPSLMVP